MLTKLMAVVLAVLMVIPVMAAYADCPKHKYIIFFKGRDNDAITAAFREYTAKAMEKARKPSILKKLQEIGAVMQNQVKERTKEKKREQTR